MADGLSDSPQGRWLSIIGIGEDGLDGMAPAARTALDRAEIVWGGKRHLALAGIATDRARPWPSPIDAAYGEIVARRGQSVAVLATGDPFHYGIGSVLAERVDPAEIAAFPAPSAFTLAAARLGWALQDTECLSVHGRSLERLRPWLQPARRLLVLSWDETTPSKLGEFLQRHGFGLSTFHVMEALGGPRERIRSAPANSLDFIEIDPLNLVAVECRAEQEDAALPVTAGLKDELFEHDGQITKRMVRALTISALRPHPGELLWDIGLGSGSVAIEWLLSHPACRAVGVERSSERAARARRNALSLGVPGLEIVEGEAPAALAGLEPPAAVFVGGGATKPGLVPLVLERLRPGGRLAVNAVTLETEAMLAQLQAEHGGTLARFSVAEAEAVGRFRGWRPAMPVTQWQWVKT